MATHRTVSLPAGDVIVVDMQSFPDLADGGHVHSCPICYENVPCTDVCSVEPDLTLDDGTLRGAFLACNRCHEVP